MSANMPNFVKSALSWMRTPRVVFDRQRNPLINSTALQGLRDVGAGINKVFGGSAIPTVTYVTEKALSSYEPLYRAIIHDDWEAATEILDDDPDALEARITIIGGTALHVAVGTRPKATDNNFVKKLVRRIRNNDSIIELQDAFDRTALSIAAAVDNISAAKILVDRLPNLLFIPNNSGNFPVETAALYGHRDMLMYLLSAIESSRHAYDPEANPFDEEHRLRVLIYTIDAELIDVAMDLLDKDPTLARLQLSDQNTSALKRIAGKKSLFISRRRFSISFISFYHRKQQARQLVKSLCGKLKPSEHKQAPDIYLDAMVMALESGVHDVVKLIVEAFPGVIYYCATGPCNPSDVYTSSIQPTRLYTFHKQLSIFHLAVKKRSADVFNYIYKMSDAKDAFSSAQDSDNNNLLHLAGKLGPSPKLNEISGEALQMQHELQWFKAVENFVHPNCRDQPNIGGKTPKMLFTEEHKDLKKDGEKWMKDTATSCTIAAALIATVMFAAAITVPGGNQDSSGFPFFAKEFAFIIFAISDVASLFTSTTSLLLFVSILTSRYAEDDFLYVLPKRLIYGLGTLFLSITFMMVSFTAIVYLVFGQKEGWVLIPVAAVACLPVASFVLLQFPLLIDLIFSTYRPGVFGKEI